MSKQVFIHEEKCVGVNCPNKNHCKMYLRHSSQSRYLIATPYKIRDGKFECPKYEESFGDKIERALQKI